MPGSSNGLDLEVIDDAFGRDADLYCDVLRVSPTASDTDVQGAFFERRKEIYNVLNQLSEDDKSNKPQRNHAERRMDAVVLAFRVLTDPKMSKMYARERQQRLERRAGADRPVKDVRRSLLRKKDTNKGLGTDPKNPAKQRRPYRSRRSKYNNQDQEKEEQKEKEIKNILSIPSDEAVQKRLFQADSADAVKITVNVESPPTDHPKPTPKQDQTSQKKNSGKISIRELQPPSSKGMTTDNGGSTRASASSKSAPLKVTKEPSVLESDNGDESSVTTEVSLRDTFSGEQEVASSGILARIQQFPLVKTVTEEVHGVYLDTTSAFDQVFNAFTLQEKDIDAVCGRIEKAKSQLNQGV